MIQTLLSSLIVAMVTGLTIIAYKHPAGYRKLYSPINIACGLVTFGYASYSIGHTLGFYEALSGVLALNKSPFISPKDESAPFWWILIPVLASAYMLFLKSLPLILDLPNAKENSNAQ